MRQSLQMRLLIILLLSPMLATSQRLLEGRVIDKTTQTGIPYATVALYKANNGTTTDASGNFSLSVNGFAGYDTLLVSSVGYQSRLVRSSNSVIELAPLIKALPGVTVTYKPKWTFDTLHRLTESPKGVLATTMYQTQVAQPFKTLHNGAILSEVSITRTNSARTIFRLRVYNTDTITNAPAEDLCFEPIEIRSKERVIIIKLDSFKISIPNKAFFVAVEWLKIPYNAYSYKGRINGKSFTETRYNPDVGMISAETKDSLPWGLDYNNIWRPMFVGDRNPGVCISATVKY